MRPLATFALTMFGCFRLAVYLLVACLLPASVDRT
jgi:hypothetical protein